MSRVCIRQTAPIIDLQAGTAHIAGPATKEERALYDHLAAEKGALARNLNLIRRALEHEQDPARREDIERNLRIGEDMLERMWQVVGD